MCKISARPGLACGFAIIAAVAISSSFFVSSAFAVPITYSINDVLGSYAVTGTITTDGTIGALSNPHFQNWSLTITGAQPALNLTPSNSYSYSSSSSGWTASSSALYWNHNSLDTFFGFQSAPTCGNACGVLEWGTGYFVLVANNPNNPDPMGYVTREGVLEVGSANVATTPLPAALPLFLSGLAGLGLIGLRRRQSKPRA